MKFLFNEVTSKNIILDVGANSGEDGLRLAVNNPNHHVIAFEPVPEMIRKIEINLNQLEQKNSRRLLNYTLIDVAISDYNGTSKFNVAGQADWGCSSLNTFSDNLDKTWPGRTDFKVTHEIEVEVLRLDSFFQKLEFDSIDFLHCDTQGSDISVLRGLGSFRENLSRGVIECASSRTVALYREQHLLEDAVFEFARWGFEIERIKPNDIDCNEVNILFKNKLFRKRASG